MAILHLKAKPGSRANQLLVSPDGTVTVRLHAPAQNGQANAALRAYLAEIFGNSKSRVELLSGQTAPFKKLALLDINDDELAAVLARHRLA